MRISPNQDTDIAPVLAATAPSEIFHLCIATAQVENFSFGTVGK
jgi:hypothetical protein